MTNNKTFNYDQIKGMLHTMRNISESTIKKKSLLEQEETEPTKNITVINDVEVKLVSMDDVDLEVTEEQKNIISGVIDNFRSQVNELTEFKPGFRIERNVIRLDGTIPDVDINFVLIAGENKGVYINADMLKLEEDVYVTIERLYRFDEVFSTSFNDIISDRKLN